jgi:L-2-hydroxyglutarate oxidase LhgO
VIGLAIARELALAGREVLILEAERAIGTSSRSSEVVHAGIYYPAGSLKAGLCVAGRDVLYRYCAERRIGHRSLGKLIVATDETQLAELHRYRRQAETNGVCDLRMLSRDEVAELEPAVACVAGLLSPSTGIVDTHGLMQACLGDAEAHGASLLLESPVEGGAARGDAIVLEVGGAEPIQIACRSVVNAAGHGSTRLARAIRGVPPGTIPRSYYAVGHYYTLAGPSPFGRLVYPVPARGGLGVHVTIDLGGRCRFGPDLGWIDRLDYRFDESRAPRFYEAIRRYYPALRDGALQPGYTGIRPRIHGPGEPAADFVIQGREAHGIDGLVNLYGIESPGLTASLAIAAHVRSLLGR